MIQTNFYIAGNLVNPPKNAKNLAYQLNYGKDQFPNAQVVTITEFEWVKENYTLLLNYLQSGIYGTGVGITEGPAFQITLTDGVTTQTAFQGFLDFTNVTIKDKISITCKAVSHATIDWLEQVSSFTFEYLASDDFQALNLPGFIDPSFYRFVPYVNNTVPNYEQAMIAYLTIYSVANAIYKEIESITGLAIEVAGVFTTIPAVLKVVVKVAYILVLLATLIKLIEDCIKFIISPVKYHAGMYVRDLMERACTYLNMKFSSEIWAPGSPYYNELIIPEKLYNQTTPTDATLLGFLVPDPNEQIGYFKGTFKQLLDAMKDKYNAKVVVTVPQGGATPTNQGTISILRRDLNALPPQYVLPDIYVPEYTYNMDELYANYLISYQIDPTDMNTEQNYQGTLFQVQTTQKSTNYLPFSAIKGLQQAQIIFARASQKTSLTVPETILQEFLIVFDTIDSVIVSIVNDLIVAVNDVLHIVNKILKAAKFFGIHIKFSFPNIPKLSKSNMAATISNRNGMMILSSDHFNIAKILILVEGSKPQYNKIHPDNDSLESAEAMWYGYHYVNSMVPAQLNPEYSDRPYGNQVMIKQYNKIDHFSWSDFLAVVANNRIYYSDGVTPAIVESLEFTPPSAYGSSGSAKIKLRVSNIWTLNLQETMLNPSGA